MTKIIPESDHAKNSSFCLVPCRPLARALGLRVEAYGDNLEFGWQHPLLDEDETLFISELDCIWAGLQALNFAGQHFDAAGRRTITIKSLRLYWRPAC